MLLRFLFLFFALSLYSCDEVENPVPEAYVNKIYRNIEADPQFNSLMSPYSAVIISGGYNNNGIMIYRQKIEGAEDDFIAYDMTCPYEISTCKMKWTSSDPLYTTCECCKSKFNIIGQYMETGSAQYPLRRYICQFVNGDLYVYNE